MRFFSKSTLLLGLALVGATSSGLHAETIRLVGPNGESPQPAKPLSVDIATSESGASSIGTYGPTRSDETLWSIASAHRPDPRFSVQQTLLAIYRLNPRAFDDQNIHQLIPGSQLRLPSAEQVAANSTEEAQRLMTIHTAKLNRLAEQEANVVNPVITPAPVAVTPEPEIAAPAAPVVAAEPEVVEPEANDVAPVVQELEQQLAVSTDELLNLEEKNHQLRLMLADVQNQVRDLEGELNDENRVRSEVEKLLAEEKERQAETARMQPSMLDKLLSSVWFVIALVLLPSLILLYLIIRLFLNKPEQVQEVASDFEAPLEPMPSFEMDAEIPDLDMDDDAMLDAEELLMGMELDDDATDSDEDDPFADLDDDDTNYDLLDEDGEDPFASIAESGEFELEEPQDADQSANGISVDSTEPAVGLEEMEKALDAFSEDEDATESEDLFDFAVPQDEADEPLDGEIDQSMLDDLLSDFDDEPNLTDTAAQPQGQDEFDALFDRAAADAADAAEQNAEGVFDSEFDLSVEPQSNTASFELGDFELAEEATPSADRSVNEPQDSEQSVTSLDDSEIESVPHESDIEAGTIAQESTSVESQDDLDSLFEQFAVDEGVDVATESDVDVTDELDELLEEYAPEIGVEESSAALETQDELDSLFEEVSGVDQTTALDGPQTQDELDSLLDEMSNSDTATLSEPQTQDELDSLFDEIATEEMATVDSEVTAQDELDSLLDEFAVPEPVLQTDEATDDDLSIDQLLEQHTDAAESVSGEQAETAHESDLESLIKENEVLASQQEGIDEGIDLAPTAEEPAELEEGSPQHAPVDSLGLPENEFGQPQDDDWLVAELDGDFESPAVASSNEPTTELLGQPEPASAEPQVVADNDALQSDPLTQQPEEGTSYPQQTSFEQELAAQLESSGTLEQELGDEHHPEQESDTAIASMDEYDEPKASEPELVFDDADLPEYGEEQALADIANEDEPVDSQELPQSDGAVSDEFVISDDELGVFDEDTAMEGLLQEPTSPLDGADNNSALDPAALEAAELDLDRLLDGASATSVTNTAGAHVEPETQATTQAAPQIEDEWPSFELTEEQRSEIHAEVPEEDKDIWAEQATQVELESEDWASQEVEPTDASEPASYMSIDELMGQIEQQEASAPSMEEEELNLEVGLNEFPDVIGDVEAFDVDSNSEAMGKLDLAKIYIEMQDVDGAKRLLNQAIELGNDVIAKEARELIATL